jgi:hypothetical protein
MSKTATVVLLAVNAMVEVAQIDSILYVFCISKLAKARIYTFSNKGSFVGGFNVQFCRQ